MRDEWDELGLQAQALNEALKEIIEVMPQGPAMYKREVKAKKAWEKFKNSFNAFDGFISPMKAVEIKEPWNDPEFLSTWKFWKDYLQEQHGQWIRSRSEVMSLKKLKEFSGDNPKKAIKLLEHAMYTRAKNFYMVSDEELETNNLKNNGPEEKKRTVFKLRKD